MIKLVTGEKRKRSLCSNFQSLVKSSYSLKALPLKLTHGLRKKKGAKFVLLKNYFSLGPNRKVSYQLYRR